MAENSNIDVLRRGQVSFDKLKTLLGQQNLPHEVTHLVEQISGVFSEAIAMSASPEPLQSTNDNVMYKNSSKKRCTQVAPKFGGRKRADPNSRNKVLKDTVEDGFTWRKYGQKEIFSAKHPRSYFRCTHKYDESCQAIRQVQQSEQHPGMFEITYFGLHTCKQAKKHCQEQENSYIINFNSNTDNPIQHFSSPPPLSSSIKQENNEEDAMSNQTSSCSVTTSLDQEIQFDFLEFDGESLGIGNIESMFSDDPFGSYFSSIVD